MEMSGQSHALATLPQRKSHYYACKHQKCIRIPMNRRQGGPQNRSKCFGEEINFLPLLGFEPWFFQPAA
jgi:hypothetical protein